VQPRRHKVAFLGLGSMGARHARVISSMRDRFEIVGGYDARRDTPLPTGVPPLADENEAIDRAEVVVIATPIETHHELVSRALHRGRHVLVEKPLCATAAEAHALVRLPSTGRLFVGHSERFNPVVRALVRLCRAQRARSFELVRLAPSSRPPEWSVLLNLGVHDLDLAAYLGKAKVTLHAGLGSDATGGSPADFAHVLFSTSSGSVGRIYVDRATLTRQRTIRLVTTRWAYDGDLLAPRLTRTPAPGGARTDVPLVMQEPLAAQAEALAEALGSGVAREIATGADGASAVELAEQAAKVCAQGASRERAVSH
jgi:UDP-N-acetylglucosamine 3-dehydrogenase